MERLSLRKPAFAGFFYPGERRELESAIHDCYLHPLGPGRLPPSAYSDAPIVAVVSPHAGYQYSGPVAAHSYLHVSQMRKPDLIVVIGPNHYGTGSGVSTYSDGAWETPLGKVSVNARAARELADATGIVEFDPLSHRREHSIEVQIPFLQQIYGDSVPFLPVSISFQDQETTALLAEGVSRLASARKTVLIASSDLTHYEPAAEARRKDLSLLETVERMDVDAFYSTLEREQVTACGFGAISTVVQAARSLGLRKGELLKYASTGDTTGDISQVVGYGSVRFI